MKTKFKIIKTNLLGLLLLMITSNMNAQTTVNYSPDNSTNFPNPERGLNSTYDPIWPPGGTSITDWENAGSSMAPLLDTVAIKSWRINDGMTLHTTRYHLAKYRNSPLDQAFLNNLTEDFSRARKCGIKLIPRFVYSWLGCEADASKAIILQHIAQLKPILQANVDVLAFVDDGFIGCWGEWHDSSNGLLGGTWGTDLTADSRAILDALFSAVPVSRMVSMRYPTSKTQYFHPSAPDIWADLTPMPATSEAYNGTNIGRAGNHCDALRSDAVDGTYGNTNIINRTAIENLSVVMSGEMDSGFGNTSSNQDCSGCTADMQLFHYSTLNANYDGTIYSGPNSTFPMWQSGGCLNTIKMSLGYRFQLNSAILPSTGSAGGALNMSFNVTNVGWASPFNPRNLELILRNNATLAVTHFAINNDPRTWKSGGTYTVTLNTTIPSNLPSGTYSMLLNLPDPQPSIYARPEYSIRMANTNMWETVTGYNSLNNNIVISNSSTNLIINPGFESGLSNWTNWGGMTLCTTSSHSGTNSISFNVAGGAEQDVTTGFTIGGNYTLSAWVKGTGAVIGIGCYDSSGTSVGWFAANATTASTFAINSVSFTIPANTVKLQPNIWHTGTSLTYVDDFSLTLNGGSVVVTGVTLSPATINFSVGTTQQLTATVAPSNATNKAVSWSSSNTSVATVDTNGLVTAVAAGTTTITVMTADGNKTATCSVTVTVPVTGVTMSPVVANVLIGATQQLIATVAPSNATNNAVSWSSTNTSVATVSTSGLVTAVAAGTTTITVTTADGSKTATCALTVAAVNLIINPGFESGLSGWTNWGGMTLCTTSSHSGSNSISFNVAGGAEQDVTTGFTIGGNYTLSAWVKGTGAVIGIGCYNSSGTSIGWFAANATTASTFVINSVTFTIPTNTVKLQPNIWHTGTSLTYVDDFSLTLNGGLSSVKGVIENQPLISSPTNDSNQALYPNPSDGKYLILELKDPTETQVSIYDLSGGLYYQTIVYEKVNHLNILELQKGIYIVIIKNQNITNKQKLIVN